MSEAAGRRLVRLVLILADEELGGAAGGVGRKLNEAVVYVLPAGDAYLQGVEEEAIATAAPGSALKHVLSGDFVNGPGSPHATAVYEPNQYVAVRG
ncbi:hypothetical protein [Myxococcus qinghaiensis]|uniref:hypothetical protein n=1 Tax=Myxococcus qinghaiensis TaxID=2906758 RepID=UPI0020A6E264|nr:hypothetical protein [Myxococcus qinghaiensis]MCP3169956.1 hypothetical protein [Myxococcus qinghaiensis]